MNIEFEATYINIDKEKVRGKLKEIGAELIKKEFLQKRNTFELPKGHEIDGGWVRVRDEEDRITMALKVCAKTDDITDQKEIEMEVSDFKTATKFLEEIGCVVEAYQENKREIWKLGNTEIMIDTWPHLEPLVEIEDLSEERVKEVSKLMGFDYSDARFCSTDYIYAERYNIDIEDMYKIPRFTFDMDNPFI